MFGEAIYNILYAGYMELYLLLEKTITDIESTVDPDLEYISFETEPFHRVQEQNMEECLFYQLTVSLGRVVV